MASSRAPSKGGRRPDRAGSGELELPWDPARSPLETVTCCQGIGGAHVDSSNLINSIGLILRSSMLECMGDLAL